MRFVFAFLLISGLFNSFAFSAEIAPMTAKIKALIVQKRLTKIEDLITQLPVDLRSRFTLVHTGHALLETSYDYPGVILFGDDAKVLLAFNGSPAQSGYSALDVLEFNETTKEYVPARFFFSPSRNELINAAELETLLEKSVYLEAKPQICTQCHGQTHHPIFETGYPDWPGFYGSERDHLYGSESKEIKGFKRFQKKAKKTARYQALIFPPDSNSKMSPYLDETSNLENYLYRPNLVLGSQLVRINGEGIYQRLKRSAYFSKYAALFALALERCDFAIADSKKIAAQLAEINNLGRQIEEFGALNLNSTMLNSPSRQINREIGAKLAALMGIDADQWNLARSNIPTNAYGYWSGFGDTMDVIHDKLVRDLMPEKIDLYYQAEGFPIPGLSSLLTPKDETASCKALAELAGVARD